MIEQLRADNNKLRHDSMLYQKENESLKGELLRVREEALWTKGTENLNAYLYRKQNFKEHLVS